MKCFLALAVLLVATTARSQSFEYLSMTQGLSDADFNTHTATAWQAFFAPVGINSSGLTATFKVSDTAQIQLDVAGLGAEYSFDIIDITRPPQVPVVTFTNGSLHQLITLQAGEHYFLDAEAVGSGLSSLQFSMVIVPEPATVILAMIGVAMAAGYSARKEKIWPQ
jgi:hypothetical protein